MHRRGPALMQISLQISFRERVRRDDPHGKLLSDSGDIDSLTQPNGRANSWSSTRLSFKRKKDMNLGPPVEGLDKLRMLYVLRVSATFVHKWLWPSEISLGDLVAHVQIGHLDRKLKNLFLALICSKSSIFFKFHGGRDRWNAQLTDKPSHRGASAHLKICSGLSLAFLTFQLSKNDILSMISSKYKILWWKSNHPHGPSQTAWPNGLKFGMHVAIG